MSNLTLQGWKQSVAAGVIETVPFQDFESALVLADDFLGTQGGWNPDDAGDPSGPGVPVSGISTSDAIISITVLVRERIYRADVTAVLDFRVVMHENLSPGLDDQTVLDNLVDSLEDLVKENLSKTNMEFVSIPSYTGTVTSGPTTASERLTIQSTITGGGRIIEPRVIALIAARGEFNLDNTWNVEYLYTEPGKSLFVMIVKYLNTDYVTIDSAATRYGVKLDPVSYRMTSGTVLPPE